MKLIFATNNQHKVDEIKKVVGDKFEIITLKEAGIDIDIPEPHNTLKENASEKSGTIHRLTGLSCFSEDTGLEVDALYGEPGVKSARYAGEVKSFDKNIDKLLANLQGQQDRSARFRTVISLILDEKEYFFEGICEGKIIDNRRGNNGFGYDAVFVPEGESRTFAELDMSEKNKFSHRKKATDKLLSFLRNSAEKNTQN
jgi:XTP/dITP diphosphohydrolase